MSTKTTPRKIILDTLKENGISVKTKKVQTHQGMGNYVRGGRDVNTFEVRLFVSDIAKAKEILTDAMIHDLEQYCLIRYGLTKVTFRDIEKYDLEAYLKNKAKSEVGA